MLIRMGGGAIAGSGGPQGNPHGQPAGRSVPKPSRGREVFRARPRVPCRGNQPRGNPLVKLPIGINAPFTHAATQVIVGQAVEVSGPAALDLLPPLGDRAQIGEVATGRQWHALLALPAAEPDLLGPHDVSQHFMDRASPEPARDGARLVQPLGAKT
jgi:hypothetical protein